MSNSEYSPELAAALDRLMPPDGTLRGNWDDVVGRVRRHGRRPMRLLRNRPLRLAVVAAAIFLLLAGVATAAYFIRQALVHASLQPAARVVALGGTGRLHTLYHCPADRLCAPFVRSVAFSRDGRRLAFFVEAFNIATPDEGFHVVDLASGADRQLPRRAATRLFGCDPPVELTWSPDGSRLAYVCTVEAGGNQAGRIYTIRPDGTGRRLLRTGTESAYWPTWSPDGKRVAFSTEPAPFVATRDVYTDRPSRWIRSAIYVVGLDGSHRQLVMRAGAAPDWSPDGTTIVYTTLACWSAGTRLVTPDGRDVTPHSRAGWCRGIGPPGVAPAAWSPGGHRLAVEGDGGLYVMDADGSHVMTIGGTDGESFGEGRPAWQPPRRKGTR